METFKNILIVRTDRIGDVILTTPVIRSLRKNFPQSRITILVAPATRDLVEGNPDLNAVLIDDRKDEHRGPAGFMKLVRVIRKQHFDIAFIFHTKRRTNLLCFFAGIPSRIGYVDNKFGFLLTEKLKDDRPVGTKHESQYCLDILRAVGINADKAEFYLPLQNSGEEWIEYFLKKQNINLKNLVAIHPGASDSSKQWPAHRFAELMDQLTQKHQSQLVVIGAGNNREVVTQILAKVKHPNSVLDLTGKTTVSHTVSLLKRCRLLISNDSGPVHLADALGTPVVSIFTRNQPGINPQRWQPLGKYSRTIVTPFKGEMSFTHSNSASPEYLELIPVQLVLEAVDDLFKLC